MKWGIQSKKFGELKGGPGGTKGRFPPRPKLCTLVMARLRGFRESESRLPFDSLKATGLVTVKKSTHFE